MTNIDPALVDQMAQTITGALAGCDLRTTGAAVYGGNVAAGAVTPLIAAAVDAARAEGYEQGEAVVREAVGAAAERRLRHFLDSPIGNRCVTCGHVKHNDLGYCQTGRCGCEDGTTVQGLAQIVQRELKAALKATP